ncbi:MAG TPA: insulinase family protein [Terriglobales bacterium]|nr:insulinase family protein [Terriglobales bacterium]
MRITRNFVVFSAILACSLSLSAQTPKKAPGTKASAGANLITIASPSPLIHLKIMVQAGSAEDPAGKEGVAAMVSDTMVEAGFGDPKAPVTKEKLAEITRPWGDAAMPSARVDKQVTTISATVPKSAFPQFVNQVLRPMLNQPLWDEKEIDRLRTESLSQITSRLRFEQQEMLGLETLDNYVLAGTPLDHLAVGTVAGLKSVTKADLAAFFKKYYTAGNMTVALSTNDPQILKLVRSALPTGPAVEHQRKFQPEGIKGRQVLIVTTPNAIATGLHAGFPISVKRGDPDYWPLFVASTYLGAHRDDFSLLYQLIRQARGYNYGDYAYMEYYAIRPYSLFPPPGTPRDAQYYSLWIRPVGHQYAHFIMKAMTAEFDRFVKNGMTPEQVAKSKTKARTLYLNYAENTERQLGYKLDDAFYGTTNGGYIDSMLKSIDAVTPEQVNAAIKKHLQVENLKYVIVTNEKNADQLASDIANNTNVVSKTNEEYHIAEPISEEKQQMLKQDEQWKAYPLNIDRDSIRIVKSDQLFETSGLAGK